MTARWPLGCVLMVGLLASGCGRVAEPAPKPKVAPTPVVAAPPRPAPEPVVVEPKAPPKPAFRLSPAVATIAAGDPGLQFLAGGDGPHGGLRDLTAQVAWSVEPAGIVAVDAGGYLRPLKAGEATITAALRADRDSAKITVADPAARPWEFANDIMPVLTRQGCNTGGCHGKAIGQNGFHLSLFGYDPAGDYLSLTRDGFARRVSAWDPDASLLLQKATGRTPHGGGQRIVPNSADHRLLADWIKAGAPESRGETHGALAEVTVEPGEVRLGEPGPQQLRVIAKFADGHRRDVTRQAVYRVNDDTAARVDPTGRAELLRRAEVDLIVRYQSHVLATRVATLINPDLKFDFAKLPRKNVIDEELYRRLESVRVPPSPPAGDGAFLRRATLDLTGEVPDTQEVRDYIKDADPDKRDKLIDRLMARRAFVQFWQIKFGDMLQISPTRFGNGAGPYQFWLSQCLTENRPWDRMVRELLTSLGDPTDLRAGGAVNYALDGMDAKVAAEQTAQRFLALRMRCAQCHDHPFDVWTQDDYFGLAAFFAKVGRPSPRPGGMMGKPLVKVDPKGQVEHLRTKQPAMPRLPKGDAPELKEDDDPRQALAEWMTRPDNPFFARAMANWAWAQFFGKGLADPPDDLSRSNPPVHPELLDALAKHFVESKYDLRALIRLVVTSNAYAASSSTVAGNERDTRFFSHHLPRPLTAHQMADALAYVTDVENRFGQLGKRRAIEVNDPSVPSAILDAFGRCPRTNGCSAVATPQLSLRQALLLIGGDVVEGKISSLNGYLSDLLTLEPAPEEVVENLYFRTLCRPPSEEERSHWAAILRGSDSLRDATEDLFWALLNSREFSFNH